MPTYVLRVRARFEAAHHLTSYQGDPEPNHGHSWQVEVAMEGDGLDEEGMAHDFVPVKRNLQELADRFDHRDINTVPPFDEISPTTEHIAAWFYGELARRLPDANLTEVTVWEGPDASATYRP